MNVCETYKTVRGGLGKIRNPNLLCFGLNCLFQQNSEVQTAYSSPVAANLGGTAPSSSPLPHTYAQYAKHYSNLSSIDSKVGTFWRIACH